MNPRNEIEMAADTVQALLAAGVLHIHQRPRATDVAGLMPGDIIAAAERRKARGFLPPRRPIIEPEPPADVKTPHVTRERRCKHCDTLLEPHPGVGRPPVYCSADCTKAAAAARQRDRREQET